MSAPTTITNILIEGNTFDFGSSTVDETTTTSYSYTTCLNITADVNLVNNYISGIVTGASNIMSINSGYGNISGNTFVRGSNTIGAYITATGSIDQTIKDNIFDSPTVDGTTETLVTGLTGGSFYGQNKNQTGYVAVPFDTDSQPYDFTTNERLMQNGTSDYVAANYNLTQIVNSGTPNVAYDYTMVKNLTSHLPKNVNVLGTKVGIKFNGTATYSGTNILFQEIFVYATNGLNFTAGTGSAADPGSVSSIDNASHTASTTGLTATPVYNFVDTSTSAQFTSSSDRFIILRSLFRYQFASVITGATFVLSPILVKFRW